MEFNLPLPPYGINHTYHTNSGRWYKDKDMKAWEDECLWRLKPKQTKMITGECTVVINFTYGNKRKNDIDSRIKCVLDLMQKAKLIMDDSLITSLQVNKDYVKNKPNLRIFLI